MDSLLIGVLPVFTLVLGATLQFWFNRASERDRQSDALRSQAYVDYLRAVALAAHLKSDEDRRDALRDAADAKARIAVYGTPSVIAALARFEEAGPRLSGKSGDGAFIALVSSMRSTAVPEHELELVLLGPPRRDSGRKES